jgi:benzylsuccinate CoA-transferase BbsF subunit
MIRSLPLESIRVIELTTGAAGPTVAKCLAEYGAEVIRIESRKRGDGHRGGNNKARWNKSPDFGKLSRNKKSVTINMATDRGKDLVRDLIRESDVVIENFSLRVMDRWGMSYDQLRAIKPDIIMIRLKGLGATGPYASHVTWGPNLLCLMGMTYLWNHHDTPSPTGEARTQHPDFMSGVAGAGAVMSALLRRARTGEGAYIDSSQIEVGAFFLAPQYMDYLVNGIDPQPAGNHKAGAGPYGAYPCAGEDKWCAIAVESQGQWQAFCQAIGSPSWCADERFATAAGRDTNRAALDELVGDWTSQRSGDEVTQVLQAAGVGAAPIQDVEDQLYHNPQFEARKLFNNMEEPEMGPIVTEDPPLKMSGSPPVVHRHAPLMGEDTDQVMRDVLHLSDSQIADLTEQGILD